MTSEGYDRFEQVIGKVENIVVLSGAGMSAESGVPTFRDKQTGLWEKYSPETLASVDGWYKDRALVWAWYMWRMALIQDKAQPNLGHLAVARLQEGLNTRVFTQNTDNLHERAGSKNVVHFHGNIARPYCEDCLLVYLDEIVMPEVEQQRVNPPRCPECFGFIRPGVVFFGEALPEGSIESCAKEILSADVVLVVGTSSIVYPVASLPFFALQNAVPVVEINPNRTAFSAEASVVIEDTAARALPKIADFLLS